MSHFSGFAAYRGLARMLEKIRNQSLQPSVFGFGLFQDGDVGVGVFQEGEEVPL